MHSFYWLAQVAIMKNLQMAWARQIPKLLSTLSFNFALNSFVKKNYKPFQLLFLIAVWWKRQPASVIQSSLEEQLCNFIDFCFKEKQKNFIFCLFLSEKSNAETCVN